MVFSAVEVFDFVTGVLIFIVSFAAAPCTVASFQIEQGVGKSADAVANCPPLTNFLLSYAIKIQKSGGAVRQLWTARGGQLATPAPPPP